MQRIHSVAALRAQVSEWRAAGLRIGFAPTMGNLHDGHLQLARRAASLADRVIVSVFVNPTQFVAGEDFDQYPRTLDADQALLATTPTDVLFAPSVAEMYPGGEQVTTEVHVPQVSVGLCGDARPGHFIGVATIVTKLFHLVQPDVAVFGEKDYQQLLVIRRLTRDLCLPIEIVGEPTCREPSGLALSSRNCYLSDSQRAEAPRLQALLQQTRERLAAGDNPAALEQAALTELRAHGWRPDYFEVRRAADLGAPGASDGELVILAAAYLGSARLIDNIQAQRPVATPA